MWSELTFRAGNLAAGRYFSKHLSLREYSLSCLRFASRVELNDVVAGIKAIEEGLLQE